MKRECDVSTADVAGKDMVVVIGKQQQQKIL